jgi:REP element-mobilizing transposase RayT
LFRDSDVVETFVEFLSIVARKHDFRSIYCFMPDHLHLVSLGLTDRSDVLQGIDEFKQLSGYWLGLRVPPVRWQKSFHDRIIRTHALAPMVQYLLENPVRRGLASHWREYPFTGAIGLGLETFLQELGPD